MADDKLGSFKVGDAKAKVVSPKKDRGSKPEEAASLGFARIEDMLESEDAVEVGKALQEIHDKLTAFEVEASTNKDKAAAKKALVAVERTIDLLDYLYQTKDALISGAEG